MKKPQTNKQACHLERQENQWCWGMGVPNLPKRGQPGTCVVQGDLFEHRTHRGCLNNFDHLLLRIS